MGEFLYTLFCDAKCTTFIEYSETQQRNHENSQILSSFDKKILNISSQNTLNISKLKEQNIFNYKKESKQPWVE